MLFVFNSYIPEKVVSAIAFPDRAGRALREVHAKPKSASFLWEVMPKKQKQ